MPFICQFFSIFHLCLKETDGYMDTSRVKSLNIQDGDLVLFKDMDVIPMPLNDVEKKAIRDADAKRR